MTKIIKRLTYGMAAILCAAGIAGCATPKNVSYFQDATPETIINVSQPLAFRAKPGDKLVIVVKTRDDIRLEESLAETLGAVVKLSANSKGKGRIVIEFTNLDQLEGIVNRIQQQGH